MTRRRVVVCVPPVHKHQAIDDRRAVEIFVLSTAS